MVEVVLPAKAAVAALIAGRDGANLTGRVEAWLAARGTAPVDGIAIGGDGSVRFGLPDGMGATRDLALAAWAAFDPTHPTAAEAAERTERDLVDAALARLDDNTATTAQMRRALAWLIRREMGRGGKGG